MLYILDGWRQFQSYLALFLEQQANLIHAFARILILPSARDRIGASPSTPNYFESSPWLMQPSSFFIFGVILIVLLREWLLISTCIKVIRRLFGWLYDVFATDRSYPWYTVRRHLFRIAKRLPMVQRRIKRDLDVALNELRRQITKSPSKAVPGDTALPPTGTVAVVFKMLPDKGLSLDEILSIVDHRHRDLDVTWQTGKTSGTVYAGNKALPHLPDLLTTMMHRYLWSNPLHPDVFPDVRQMEAEVIHMCITMFNGDERCCGSMTSGGTESILLACKAHRDYFRAEHSVTKPEIIVPISAHAAFQKSAEYLGMRWIPIPIDSRTGQVSVRRMARAISGNTVLLVASAPNFPHGIMDPVYQIARLARRARVGCHVDACLGGFLLPFAREATDSDQGFNEKRIPPTNHANDHQDNSEECYYDRLLTIPGVTSVSCDTHKYGFAPKGSSILMYTSHELRQYQYSVAADWPGGIYASPTLAGSRAGATIAGCWAAMVSLGREGYIDTTRRILRTSRRIRDTINTLQGLYVIGEPRLSVIAFASRDFDIYRLGTEMATRGWHLNSLQRPACLHLCVTLLHDETVCNQFLKDLGECTTTLLATLTEKASGMAAIYGLGATLPDRALVDLLARGYLDVLYDTL